ncbi:alpha/beta hydrolase family protein [Streptomyces sp. 1331.2]|uniref:alpha/beta hydrolase family protein n=1 Tax=Streptomyces sp. 1331.2 TaxID=1938835 RepID=UPI000BE31E49|nr:acetylhydrolase [Streptomyces sp. 1331.2]
MDTTPFASRTGLTRRRMLRSGAAALAVGAAVPLGLTDTARAASAPSPGSATGTAPSARLTLPAPTGPCPVGMVPLHLRDTSRPDPAAGPGRFRELMATVWYPARSADAAAYPLAPWMTDGALRAFLTDVGFALDPSLAPLTSGHQGAPVHRSGHRLPVVVFSHGAGSHRADHTVIVQELASHGYAVLTVDHTYDAFTEFPDGTVSTPSDSIPIYPRDHAADARFVLDCVEGLAAGRNPDVDGRVLPAGLLGALDPDTVGMFGWSKGGTATTLAMGADPRIRAGLAVDGPMMSNPAPSADLDRPFMMMTADFARAVNPAAQTFWTHLRGWRLDIQATGAVHSSYGDNMTLVPQAAKLLGLPVQQVRQMVGTLDPDRGIRIQQAYPLAFFDLHLRHRGRHLLDGPSQAFPEVAFHG